MKRNNFWMLLFIFGVLSSIFTSCRETVERGYITYYEYLYLNKTTYSITMNGYQGSFDGSSLRQEKWMMAPGESFQVRIVLDEGVNKLNPLDCDSIQLIFDGLHEVWYRKSDADSQRFYQSITTVQSEKRYIRYQIDITQALCDAVPERAQ